MRTIARVEELLVARQRVTGVRLDDGEELRAPYVMTSLQPEGDARAAAAARACCPTICSAAPRRIPTNVLETTTLKIDVAVSGRLDDAAPQRVAQGRARPAPSRS